MSTPSIDVAQAEAALAAAKVAARSRRRTELIEQLSTVRKELHVRKAELETLSRAIDQGQSQLNNVRAQIDAVVGALAAHQDARPAIVEYLPDDPDAARWIQINQALEEEQARLVALRAALPNIEVQRFNGVQLAKRVQELLWSEQSILSELENRLGKWPEGSVGAPSSSHGSF